MLQLSCPWCGPRAESEFTYGGEANIVRPRDSESISDREWGEYLFMRDNTKGEHLEQWFHAFGCRRWFIAQRNTVTYRFSGFYKIGEQPQQGGGHDAK